MNLPRAPWEELEIRDGGDEKVLYHPGWTNNPETLVISIREVGWFATNAEAWSAAERAELKWGWVGLDDDRNLVLCLQDGTVPNTDEIVTDVEPVTLALIPTST